MAAQRYNQAVLAEAAEAIQRDGQALFDLLWGLGFRPREEARS